MLIKAGQSVAELLLLTMDLVTQVAVALNVARVMMEVLIFALWVKVLNVGISIETSFETHAETTAGVKKNGEEYRRLSAEEKGILFADSSLVYANMESHSVPNTRKRKSILIGDC